MRDVDHGLDSVGVEPDRKRSLDAFLRHYLEGPMQRLVLGLHSWELLALLTVAALAFVYAAAIHAVDPRGDFGRRPTAGVVLDARAEKIKRFQSSAAGPMDGLILGSSRSMKLDPAPLEKATGHRFFNFSVEGARAEDYLEIYRWVRSQDAHPRVVIIGLDVEALHSDDRHEARRPLPAAGEAKPASRWHVFRYRVSLEKKAFGASYLGDAVRALAFLPWSSRLPFYAFGPDGYLRYPQLEERRAWGTFDLDRRVADCLPVYQERFKSMTGLSASRRRDLEETVREATADGARVIVWLTTLHPRAVEYLGRRTRYALLAATTRTYLETLAREPQVRVLDLSEAGRYGASLTGWYDCAHIDEDNAARVMARLATAIR